LKQFTDCQAPVQQRPEIRPGAATHGFITSMIPGAMNEGNPAITGFFRRRRDRIELLRVQDVYVKQQGLFYWLLNLGTVVIESSEERLPVHYLTGVNDLNGLMDLIWHHARKERDLRSVKVDEV
jgi:Bacterial PH domain